MEEKEGEGKRGRSEEGEEGEEGGEGGRGEGDFTQHLGLCVLGRCVH